MDNLRVLLIEDDRVTRTELGEILSKEALNVIEACDGNEGRTLFESESPDIVITDLRMPGMSGLEVMEAINNTRPCVPVILTTAYGETDVALQAIRLGALDYIKKPIDLDDFMVALGRAKERVKNNRQLEEFPSVLIAEDDDVARRSLANVLVKEGLCVLQAENGQQAVDHFKQNKVDIILLDIKMPKMDGLDALRQMRQLNDDFETIILTGYGDEMTAIAALRQGAMSFIRKPIDLEEVLALIDKATEKIALKRSLKFRTREVELAYQIIAQISQKEEIMIRLSEEMLHHTKKFASNILNYISDGVVLIDKQMSLLFMNKPSAEALENTPRVLTREVARRLFGTFRREVDYEGLTRVIGDTFAGDLGQITRIGDEKHPTAITTKINLKINRIENEYTVLIVCSEMPTA
jgi:DNA-binding NtrC family response regulator